MATLNPYLNFDGNAEEAFNFYKQVFGGDFMGGVMRWKDAPESDKLTEEERNKVMHVALPISKEVYLMASDLLESMGQKLSVGNNCQIMIAADSRDEADRLFKGLSDGGKVEMPMADQFWGGYFGAFKDKFGVDWSVHYSENQQK